MKLEQFGGRWVASVRIGTRQLCAIGESRFAAWGQLVGLLSDEALRCKR